MSQLSSPAAGFYSTTAQLHMALKWKKVLEVGLTRLINVTLLVSTSFKRSCVLSGNVSNCPAYKALFKAYNSTTHSICGNLAAVVEVFEKECSYCVKMYREELAKQQKQWQRTCGCAILITIIFLSKRFLLVMMQSVQREWDRGRRGKPGKDKKNKLIKR